MVAITRKPAGPKAKVKSQTFILDCSKPVEDKIMDIASFEKFLLDKVKVDGKTGEPQELDLSICAVSNSWQRLDDVTGMERPNSSIPWQQRRQRQRQRQRQR
jgi:Ribosomal L22e protein family